MAPRLVLVLLPLFAAACGGGTAADRDTATVVAAPPTTSTATSPAAPTSLVAYFLRDGRVAPVRVEVARTAAVAKAALGALAGAAPSGYATAVPDLADVGVRVDGGVAKPGWDEAALSHAAAAQVVYTLTEFPSIRAVELPDGTQARRASFEDVAPPIIVEDPLPGDAVRSPISVKGTASVFEATVVVELTTGGEVLQRKTVTASTGAPERGVFSASFDTAARGGAAIVAFSPSAADGSEQHRVEVPVQIVG